MREAPGCHCMQVTGGAASTAFTTGVLEDTPQGLIITPQVTPLHGCAACALTSSTGDAPLIRRCWCHIGRQHQPLCLSHMLASACSVMARGTRKSATGEKDTERPSPHTRTVVSPSSQAHNMHTKSSWEHACPSMAWQLAGDGRPPVRRVIQECVMLET